MFTCRLLSFPGKPQVTSLLSGSVLTAALLVGAHPLLMAEEQPPAANAEVAQSAAERVSEVDGLIVVEPRYSTEGINNPWPASYMPGYLQRADTSIRMFQGKSAHNTSGEHEKWNYPRSVGAWLAGDRVEAIAALQAQDIDKGDHAWTNGIDLYWCFTLKGQVQKFFYFEHDLEPAYREQMLEAFRILDCF